MIEGWGLAAAGVAAAGAIGGAAISANASKNVMRRVLQILSSKA